MNMCLMIRVLIYIFFFSHLGFDLEMISIVPVQFVAEDTVKVSFILDVREHNL